MKLDSNLLAGAVLFHLEHFRANQDATSVALDTLKIAEFAAPWLPLLVEPVEWLPEWEHQYPTVYKHLVELVVQKGWDVIRPVVNRYVADTRSGMTLGLMEHLLSSVPPLEEHVVQNMLEAAGVHGFGSMPVRNESPFWRKAETRLIYVVGEAAAEAAMDPSFGQSDDRRGDGESTLRTLRQYGLRIVADKGNPFY